jgi:hypothetical protein
MDCLRIFDDLGLMKLDFRGFWTQQLTGSGHQFLAHPPCNHHVRIAIKFTPSLSHQFDEVCRITRGDIAVVVERSLALVVVVGAIALGGTPRGAKTAIKFAAIQAVGNNSTVGESSCELAC